MSTNTIGAETAHWAGLQIDLHSKFRSGNLSAKQLEWWLNQSKETRDAIIARGKFATKKSENPPNQQTEKFALLVDLGIITVPDNYDHTTSLKSFMERNREKFCRADKNITDQNFSNPTCILKPGDKLHVRVFKQIVEGITTSEERMAFLVMQKAVYVGAQGASLVFEQKRDQLPKGMWYTSFDKKERLYMESSGYHMVSRIGTYLSNDDDFSFRLGNFEGALSLGDAFLCFSELFVEGEESPF